MPTECTPDQFEFARVEGRKVVAGFDGGALTSDAGALLLGATDRTINLVGRLADCFQDARKAELVEHEVATLVGQRVKRRAKGTPYGRRKGTPFSRSSSGEARSPQLAQRVAAG